MYKYETHVHCKEASRCAISSAKELVYAYHKLGYAGFVLTDHFIHGNTNIPKDLSWNERMQLYYNAFLEAKEEGDKLDFDVLFGIEHAYGDGKEILIYGIDLEFLQAHPELENASIDVYAKLVHETGGLLIHAHPYRDREYINPNVLPRYDLCDGIEVYNAADSIETNQKGYNDALELNMIMTSGGDIHFIEEKRIGTAGVAFKNRIRNNAEFVSALKRREGTLILQFRTENL